MILSPNIFKYLSLTILVLINDLEIYTCSLVSIQTECLIHSSAYKFEYLYTTKEHDSASSEKRNVYTYPLGDVDDFDKIRWKFIPVNGSNSTFYIRSQEYKEYLCAASSYKDLFKMRRKLHTIKIGDRTELSESFQCEWIFEKVPTRTSNNTYFIWNVMYEEPLYAISYFYKNHKLKRNVYLWHKKPNSKQFKWQVDCLSGEFLFY